MARVIRCRKVLDGKEESQGAARRRLIIFTSFTIFTVFTVAVVASTRCDHVTLTTERGDATALRVRVVSLLFRPSRDQFLSRFPDRNLPDQA